MECKLRAVDQSGAENVGVSQREIAEIVSKGDWETRGSSSTEVGLRDAECGAAV